MFKILESACAECNKPVCPQCSADVHGRLLCGECYLSWILANPEEQPAVLRATLDEIDAQFAAKAA